MNNEQMDALFRKVFGDVENGDEQLLGSLNGEAINREETILSNLKMELKNLGEVPECQLSTDRLRDAILAKGTMREPVSPFMNWWKFAVPVAACAVLVAFVMQMPKGGSPVDLAGSSSIATNVEIPSAGLKPNVEPNDVVVPPVNEQVNPSADKEEIAPLANSELSKKASQNKVNKNSQRNSSKPRQQFASRDTSEKPQALVSNAGDIASMALADTKPKSSSSVADLAAGALKGFGKRNAAPAARTGAASKPEDSSPKVVIVAAGTDPNTRASNATEVDKKNVVFGG